MGNTPDVCEDVEDDADSRESDYASASTISDAFEAERVLSRETVLRRTNQVLKQKELDAFFHALSIVKMTTVLLGILCTRRVYFDTDEGEILKLLASTLKESLGENKTFSEVWSPTSLRSTPSSIKETWSSRQFLRCFFNDKFEPKSPYLNSMRFLEEVFSKAREIPFIEGSTARTRREHRWPTYMSEKTNLPVIRLPVA